MHAILHVSLSYKVSDGYVDDKFGILIHRSVDLVPEFGNEWYPCKMYLQDNAVAGS